jgi:trans-2,3-dihydro-3-hydroxyanthranilate isomerase
MQEAIQGERLPHQDPQFPKRKADFVSLSVFGVAGGGGNPCTVVTCASELSEKNMLETAGHRGHECVFMLPAIDPTADIRLRFFSPAGEMAMCGHASLGAVWVLGRNEEQSRHVLIETTSGILRAQTPGSGEPQVSIACPTVSEATVELVLPALALLKEDVVTAKAFNVFVARPKTLVQLANVEVLHKLSPTLPEVAAACARLGTTGLYPWARAPDGTIHARQFPADAGYLEDPATGIAAVALYRVLDHPRSLDVFQGETMGFPSRIRVEGSSDRSECWMSGRVVALTLPRRMLT